MNLDVICTILKNAGAATPGVDLFQNYMPDDVSRGLLLRLPMTGVRINHYIPGYLKTQLQLIVRDVARAAAYDRGIAVSKILTIYNAEYDDDQGNMLMRINHIFPATLPVTFQRMPGNQIEASVSFDCNYLMPL